MENHHWIQTCYQQYLTLKNSEKANKIILFNVITLEDKNAAKRFKNSNFNAFCYYRIGLNRAPLLNITPSP